MPLNTEQFASVNGLIKQYNETNKQHKELYDKLSKETKNLRNKTILDNKIQELEQEVEKDFNKIKNYKLLKLLRRNNDELAEVISDVIKKSDYTDSKTVLQIMWFAYIKNDGILEQLAKKLFAELDNKLTQKHIFYALSWVLAYAGKHLDSAWQSEIIDSLVEKIKTYMKIDFPEDSIENLHSILIILTILIEEINYRHIKFSNQYKRDIKSILSKFEERLSDQHELLNKVEYAKEAVKTVPSFLFNEEKRQLFVNSAKVFGRTLELIAAGIAVPFTFGLSTLILAKDVALLSIDIHELINQFPRNYRAESWFTLVRDARTFINLIALTESCGVSDQALNSLWDQFESVFYGSILSDKFQLKQNYLQAIIPILELLSNIVFPNELLDKNRKSKVTHSRILNIIHKIYNSPVKMSSIPFSHENKKAETRFNNIQKTICIYIGCFCNLPEHPYLLNENEMRYNAIRLFSHVNFLNLKEKGKAKITKIINNTEMLKTENKIIPDVWKKGKYFSYIYYKLYEYTRTKLEKADLISKKTSSDIYIELDCRERTNAASDNFTENKLKDRFNNFICPSDQKKVMWLLGDAGSGKTSSVHQLLTGLKDNYKAGEYLPVLITLTEYLDNPEQCLRSVFKNFISENDLNGVIESLKNDSLQPLLFTFDGYDEVFMDKDFDIYSSNNSNANHLEEWIGNKVLITARTEYRPEEADFKDLLAKCDNDLQCIIYLKSLTDSDIERYIKEILIRRKFDGNIDRISSDRLELIKSYPAIKALATNPLFLSFIVDLIIDKNTLTYNPSRIDLFEAILNNWFKREYEKFDKSQSINDLKYFTRELAHEMFKQEQFIIPFSEVAKKTSKFENVRINTGFIKFMQGDDRPLIEAHLHGSPLRLGVRKLPEDPNSEIKGFEFINDNFRIYYFAECLFNIFETSDEVNPNNLNIISKTSLKNLEEYVTTHSNKGVMEALDHDSTLNFLVDFVERATVKREQIKNFLLTLVNLKNVKYQHVSSLAMSVLNRAKLTSFNDKDFSGAKLPHADLSHGVFQKTKLNDTNLEYADMRKSVWVDANLTDAKMKGVKLENPTDTDDYPKKVAIDMSKRLVAIAYSRSHYKIRELTSGRELHSHTFKDFEDITNIIFFHGGQELNLAVFLYNTKDKKPSVRFHAVEKNKTLQTVTQFRTITYPINEAARERYIGDVFVQGNYLMWSRPNKLVLYTISDHNKRRYFVQLTKDNNANLSIKTLCANQHLLCCLLDNSRLQVYDYKKLVDHAKNKSGFLSPIKNDLLLNDENITDVAISNPVKKYSHIALGLSDKINIIQSCGTQIQKLFTVITNQITSQITFSSLGYLTWLNKQRNQIKHKCYAIKSEKLKEIKDIKGHEQPITHICGASIDNQQFLFTSSQDGSVKQWGFKKNKNFWKLSWTSKDILVAFDCDITGAELYESDINLLTTHGTIGNPECIPYEPPPIPSQPTTDPDSLPDQDSEMTYDDDLLELLELY